MVSLNNNDKDPKNEEGTLKFRSFYSKKEKSSSILEEISLRPEELRPNHEKDQILESFEFNSLEENDQLEKQRFVWAILERNGYIDEFNIPLQTFCDFVHIIKKKYNKKKNPFHNFDHGISGKIDY